MTRNSKISDFQDLDNWSKRIRRGPLVDRDEKILELCDRKSVLHIGAADSPFHIEKVKTESLLQQKLTKICKIVHGVDADSDAVKFLRSNGIDNIFDVNEIDFNKQLLAGYEVILLCDVLEHVTDMQAVFDKYSSRLLPDGILVFSSINAGAIKLSLRGLFNREAVHPDHICYFSYATAGRLLLKCGFSPFTYFNYKYPEVSLISKMFFGTLFYFSTNIADGIMIISKKT